MLHVGVDYKLQGRPNIANGPRKKSDMNVSHLTGLRTNCPVCGARLLRAESSGWRFGVYLLDGVRRHGIACVEHLVS
jgi:hypothetical protein